MTPWLPLALLAAAQAVVLSALLTPLARRIGERGGFIDEPGLDRKVHDRPIPRSGGIALFIAFWGCLGMNLAAARWLVPTLDFLPENVRVLAANVGMSLRPLAGIAVGSTLIFVLGLLDDRLNLPAKLRLLVQVLAVVPLILSGISLQLFLPTPLAIAATALWVVLLTNSFNFLDNMNGLTSGVAMLCAAVLALLSLLSREYFMLLMFALLSGAACGFWAHNFFRGNIFLGDSGSTHLGFLFGALTIVATWYEEGVPSRFPVLMPVIVLAIPLFDTLSVLWIRWRTGKPFMEGDRNHFSHRLVDLGFTKREAVVLIYGFTLVVGLAAVALRQLDSTHALVQTAMIALLFAIIHRLERVSRRKALRPSDP